MELPFRKDPVRLMILTPPSVIGHSCSSVNQSEKVHLPSAVDFVEIIVYFDRPLTATHAKAHEASTEKASRAFYIVFNFMHNRRKKA